MAYSFVATWKIVSRFESPSTNRSKVKGLGCKAETPVSPKWSEVWFSSSRVQGVERVSEGWRPGQGRKVRALTADWHLSIFTPPPHTRHLQPTRPEYRNHSRRDGKKPVEIWTSFVKQIIFLLNWNVSSKQQGSTAGQNINHLLTIYEFQFPGTSPRPNWSWMMLLSVSPKMLIKCVSGAALVYTIDLLSGLHVWDISRISSDSDSKTEPGALLRCPTSIQPNWARYISSRNVRGVWQCPEWRVQYLERVPTSAFFS